MKILLTIICIVISVTALAEVYYDFGVGGNILIDIPSSASAYSVGGTLTSYYQLPKFTELGIGIGYHFRYYESLMTEHYIPLFVDLKVNIYSPTGISKKMGYPYIHIAPGIWTGIENIADRFRGSYSPAITIGIGFSKLVGIIEVGAKVDVNALWHPYYPSPHKNVSIMLCIRI